MNLASQHNFSRDRVPRSIFLITGCKILLLDVPDTHMYLSIGTSLFSKLHVRDWMRFFLRQSVLFLAGPHEGGAAGLAEGAVIFLRAVLLHRDKFVIARHAAARPSSRPPPVLPTHSASHFANIRNHNPLYYSHYVLYILTLNCIMSVTRRLGVHFIVRDNFINKIPI